MDYGLFTMPSHPPERKLFDGHQWDLQQLRWADELGFSEAWIGEHHTSPWEPHPSPDLLVAQALMQTKRMRIGPGGFLMPYHHPAELANRVAMLDHMAQGRLNFGVAASGLPSDWAMFNVDGVAGQHREMTREALDIILRLWSDEPEFDHKGKYWHVTKTGTMLDTLRAHPEARRVAPGPRGLHRRHRRRGHAPLGRRHDGPDDAGVLPAAAGVVPVHRVLEAQAGRAGLRRHSRVLRAAQLAGRLAGYGGRQASRHLRGGRRLRDAAALLLRLLGESQGVAPLDRASGEGSHAEVQGAGPEVTRRTCSGV